LHWRALESGVALLFEPALVRRTAGGLQVDPALAPVGLRAVVLAATSAARARIVLAAGDDVLALVVLAIIHLPALWGRRWRSRRGSWARARSDGALGELAAVAGGVRVPLLVRLHWRALESGVALLFEPALVRRTAGGLQVDPALAPVGLRAVALAATSAARARIVLAAGDDVLALVVLAIEERSARRPLHLVRAHLHLSGFLQQGGLLHLGAVAAFGGISGREREQRAGHHRVGASHGSATHSLLRSLRGQFGRATP